MTKSNVRKYSINDNKPKQLGLNGKPSNTIFNLLKFINECVLEANVSTVLFVNENTTRRG